MTPAARYAAAIALIDEIAGGAPAEKALTTWGRQNRFAGSRDRAAIRDVVYDVLRGWRSLAALGGGETGRARVLGLLRREGIAPESVFGAGGYGPAPLSEDEARAGRTPVGAEALDLPDWLWPLWQDALGPEAEAAARRAQHRAPLGLRVNLSRGPRAEAQARLAEDGITTVEAEEVATGLIVTDGGRKLAQSAAYAEGLVEVQDVSSQIAMAALPITPGMRVLDYCAGGGGKALALADRGAQVVAHDADPGRMADIAPRAARAGVSIRCRATAELGREAPFDLVLCDAPCSGSGTWARGPQAKWALTPEALERYTALQRDVLEAAAPLVAPGGHLAYATCSVLTAENDGSLRGFAAAHPGWREITRRVLVPQDTHDGFFLALLQSEV